MTNTEHEMAKLFLKDRMLFLNLLLQEERNLEKDAQYLEDSGSEDDATTFRNHAKQRRNLVDKILELEKQIINEQLLEAGFPISERL